MTTINLRRQPVIPTAAEVLDHYHEKFGTEPEEPGGWIHDDDWRRLSYVLGILDPGGSVLDVGLGAGQFINMLAASGKFDAVHGTDPTRFKKYSEFYPGIQSSRESIAQLPYSDGQFDVVTCMEVLEHVPEDVLTAGLTELRRVCRGQLVMTVPFREPEPISKTHVRRFEADDITRVFPEGRYTLLDRPRMPWMLIEERPADTCDALAQLRRRITQLEAETARLQSRKSLRLANWAGRQRRRLRSLGRQ